MKASRRPRADQELSSFDQLVIDKVSGKDGVSLAALVSDLSRDLHYTTDRVTEGLMSLQSRKLIVISEKVPSVSFASYIVSPTSLWFWGALSATLLSVALVFVTSGPAIYLRYVFGGLLILFLPGYSLIGLLYPKKELEELTRLVLSIGLSLALVPLVGLVLNFTPFGVRLLPIAFSLAGLTGVLLVLTVRRRQVDYKMARRSNGLT